MRIAGALILALLLSTTICKGEENRDQEAEEDPATENFYLWLLQVWGTSVLLCTLANFVGIRHVAKSKKLGGQVVMRRAAAARRRLLICQNLGAPLRHA